MNRIPRRWPLLALAAALALTSCSEGPTAPVATPAGVYQDPHFIEVPDPAASRAGVRTATVPASITVSIDGAKGGCIELGRFGLEVPEGAWAGVSEVTLRLSDPKELRVDLVIAPEPASLAHPLQLMIDCTAAIGVSDTTHLDLVHNNGRNGIWYRVGSSTMGDCGWQFRAPVSLSPSYGVLDGRAGW